MRIAIAGCTGRMGATLMQQALATPEINLVAASVRPGSEDRVQLFLEKHQLGGLSLPITTNPASLFAAAETVIDFTTPEHCLELAALAADHGKRLVSGTTGLSPEQHAELAVYAERAPILWAPNMSVGINLLAGIIREVASILDEEFDIEILEMHHRYKADAPSGTAMLLGEAAAAGRGIKLSQKSVMERSGHTGPRTQGDIGFATLRGGDVIGDHTAIFAGDGERLELTHRSSERHIYAKGAIRGARWLHNQPPGLYGMQEVLGLA